MDLIILSVVLYFSIILNFIGQTLTYVATCLSTIAQLWPVTVCYRCGRIKAWWQVRHDLRRGLLSLFRQDEEWNDRNETSRQGI